MTVTVIKAGDAGDWARLRHELWPESTVAEHAADIAAVLAAAGDTLNLMARTGAGFAAGFAEAALRHDYVNGCETSPVAFLEGLYVAPEHRQRGVARQLVAAVEDWARSRGCSELASDALLDNTRSHRMHEALGFAETERVVYFRKLLG